MTYGGEGSSGYKYSKEIREVISKKQRKNYQDIQQEFEKRKYKLLTEEKDYKNCYIKLKYICPKGHEGSISWSDFQQKYGCPICHNENRKGENSSHHKLTERDVIQIKLLLKEGKLTQKEIADMFGVSVYTISDIKREITWYHIKI